MIAMRNTTNSTEIRAYDGQTCQYEPSRDMNVIETIIKHGRYAAAKWARHTDSRQYWEARYCGIQALYSDLTNSATAYADFNAHCGVTFEAGHITAADGTTCID